MSWNNLKYPTWDELEKKKQQTTHGVNEYFESKPNIGTLPQHSYIPYDKTYDGLSALNKKNAAQSAVNNYQFSDYSKLEDYKKLLEQYNTRDPYSFDINSDALYQQYADLYAKQGKLAMEDTMAQAAALTGGYGNSYAQSAGQQTYQQYMNMLNEIGLDIEQNAYNRYQQEGQDMLTQIGLHQNEMDREHALDVEEYNRLVNEANTASTDYSNGLSEYLTEHQYGTNIDQQNWQNYWTEENNKAKKESATDLSGSNDDSDGKNITTTSDYADFDPLDWEAYFAYIRQSEGESAAKQELDRMTSDGLIPKNMVTYAAIGVRGGSKGH